MAVARPDVRADAPPPRGFWSDAGFLRPEDDEGEADERGEACLGDCFFFFSRSLSEAGKLLLLLLWPPGDACRGAPEVPDRALRAPALLGDAARIPLVRAELLPGISTGLTVATPLPRA